MAMSKVMAERASAILEVAELESDAAAVADPGEGPEAFLRCLVQEKQFAAALRFLAFALPRREAVWWACLAARKTLRPDDAAGEAALSAAEAWVYRPVEDNRVAARAAADAAGSPDRPAVLAALAAAFSGGSLAPPESPPVPPPETLCAQMVAAAVTLAAVAGDARRVEERYTVLLRQGFEIADGGDGRRAERAPA